MPAPFAPAQVVQFCHPVIWSIFDITTDPEGGAGRLLLVGVGVGDAVGVGEGVGEVPLTVIESAWLEIAPVESQALITTECDPLPTAMLVLMLEELVAKTLVLSM